MNTEPGDQQPEPDGPTHGRVFSSDKEEPASEAYVLRLLGRIAQLQRELAGERRTSELLRNHLDHAAEQADIQEAVLRKLGLLTPSAKEERWISGGDPVAVPRKLVDFLLGRSELEGVNFGEQHPMKKGKFWWRSALGACTEIPFATQETIIEQCITALDTHGLASIVTPDKALTVRQVLRSLYVSRKSDA